MMRVVLGDGSIHEVDARDVALLHANSAIHINILPSRDMFTRFAEYVTRHRAVPQPEGLADWDRQYMDQILDTNTLKSLRLLALMINQVELVNLCDARAVELGIDDGGGAGGSI